MDHTTIIPFKDIKKQLKNSGNVEHRYDKDHFRIKTNVPLYGFKKVYLGGIWIKEAIVNLIIPPDSVIVCAGSHKLRTNKAFVHSIVTCENRQEVEKAVSGYDKSFEYRKHALIVPEYGFDRDVVTTCAAGIHFFLDLKGAYNY